MGSGWDLNFIDQTGILDQVTFGACVYTAKYFIAKCLGTGHCCYLWLVYLFICKLQKPKTFYISSQRGYSASVAPPEKARPFQIRSI